MLFILSVKLAPASTSRFSTQDHEDYFEHARKLMHVSTPRVVRSWYSVCASSMTLLINSVDGPWLTRTNLLTCLRQSLGIPPKTQLYEERGLAKQRSFVWPRCYSCFDVDCCCVCLGGVWWLVYFSRRAKYRYMLWKEQTRGINQLTYFDILIIYSLLKFVVLGLLFLALSIIIACLPFHIIFMGKIGRKPATKAIITAKQQANKHGHRKK